MTICVIDDEEFLCDALALYISKLGPYTVHKLTDPRKVVNLISTHTIDLIFTDVRMPHLSGIDVANEVKKQQVNTKVVLISGQSDIIESINAFEIGVYDFLIKPVDVNKIIEIIRSIEIQNEQQRKSTHIFNIDDISPEEEVVIDDILFPPEIYVTRAGVGEIIIASEAMKSLYKKIKKIHDYPDIPVFIEGRTGTGKEVIARSIHYQSPDIVTPFIALNCAAIEKNLFESELFGYEKGAFTDAQASGKTGKIKLAEGGSLFLDEITEISIDLQSTLLRVLQEKEYYKVGGNEKQKVNTRIICATNRDIKELVAQGLFRQDLFYRLDVCKVTIPPLNQRREEIIPLLLLYIKEMNRKKKIKVKKIAGDVLIFLYHYDWDGNIRQLKNAVTKALLFNESKLLSMNDFDFLEKTKKTGLTITTIDDIELPEEPFSLEQLNETIIRKTLIKFNGNKSKTAQFLGLQRLQLYNRYKKIIDGYENQ
ncbi:MAG: sigma-54-dependent Fis family transcriptional regulator [Spirochaetales bacterium]|nr:sigma-54-dependent Fis family transcriptional regulator [Spirochaetales bacterium]